MTIKDVKRNGNCLLWAVIVSYLEQVKTNKQQFKKRYIALFGRKKGWKRIFNFTKFNFDDNKNKKLVKIFRKRICNYLQTHLDIQRPENKGDFRSVLIDSEINKKIKKLYPNYNQEQQIKTTLEIMRTDGEITGSVEIEAICNMLNCNIIRINNSFEIANNEIFQPDYVITNKEIKLQYENEHYKYFSNVPTVVNVSNAQQMANETEQNDEFLVSARLIIKKQLLNKHIDEENHNAIVDIFIEDIVKASATAKNEILKKSIFELNNQDKLLTNPNLVFEEFVTPIINNEKTTIQQLTKTGINQSLITKVS